MSNFRKKRHILIVDDDPIVARATRRSIEDLHCKVSIVTQPRDVCPLFSKTEKPDLIIMDYDLGPKQINGVQLTNVIKYLNKKIPIVLYTSTPLSTIEFNTRARPDYLIAKGRTIELNKTILDALVAYED